MKFSDVAENIKRLLEDLPSQEAFIYEFLLAYGSPKATVARLKNGSLNLAKEPGEVLLKKKVWFKIVNLTTKDHKRDSSTDYSDSPDFNLRTSAQSVDQNVLYSEIEKLKTAKATKTNAPRFLIVTDFKQILAVDRKTGETLDIEFQELATHVDFFIPLTPGLDKHTLPNENPADVRAAEKMAKLFDAIKQDNPDYMREDEKRDERLHAMNVFLSRLLFCLFAEDTGIFPENAVCNAIASHTADDGSDLDLFFKHLFDWLDTPPSDRKTVLTTEGTESHRGNTSTDYSDFTDSNLRQSAKSVDINSIRNLPYVNGGLFKDHFELPVFSRKSRRMIITSGELNWSEINPDIFGSMFQAVIDPEERHNLGQHYTSVTNIMKVIEPLFLNDFKAELERAKNLSQKNVRTKALQRLLDRIAKVKIFDPACGSGNFLIIAYKELRQLEMEVFEALNAFPVSKMTVDQFYGIEIADFACETAILALWLAEHQMNLEYEKRFGHSLTSLPLKDGANIVCDNATRIDWESVCPKPEDPDSKDDEIYILGNPPYLGYSLQDRNQKDDMAASFAGIKNFKKLDYIACWFMKGAEYIKGNHPCQCAFVSTNSLCQGEQVALLWPQIYKMGIEISFAHQSFKWGNSAKGNAVVTCIIVGLRSQYDKPKYIFSGNLSKQVPSINAYLTVGSDTVVNNRSKPLSSLPRMLRGSGPSDGGNLLLSSAEKDALIVSAPEAIHLIKRFVGSDDFIKGNFRWCLWVEDEDLKLANSIPLIRERFERVKEMRLRSPKAATQELASSPHRFAEIRRGKSHAILIPRHSGERRKYIPFGFLDEGSIISDSAQAIYDPEPWIFGIITSITHMAWVRATCGKLETRIRYSSQLCYNTFPIPDLTEEQKQMITMHVFEILNEREKHPEKTMAQLYDPDKMPDGLRTAHHNLDLAVDRLYRQKPFTSDEERLEHLFKLYEEMVAKKQLV